MTSPPKIRVLPESISCQIAAGEVVDRPASVVKELVDNSLDAGSTMITVEVDEGGKRLIRVTDNGEGMTRDDAQLACQRFATSKLTCPEDLSRISTFGFRGEALPSIASVSRFRLATAHADEEVGTELMAEGGPVSSVKDRASSRGTQVEVKDLFFNTPGRQKFLKTSATEFSHVCHVVQQAALTSPGTQFRLIHNRQTVFDFPSAGSLEDRLLQLYGMKMMERMLPIEWERGDVKVKGIVVHPYHSRTSRTPQEIFVNGRPVRNSTILHAVYEAYGSFLPKGRHPIFALLLEIDPAQVDVNVHPSKREVKFSAPDLVHRIVKEAVRRQLQHKSTMVTTSADLFTEKPVVSSPPTCGNSKKEESPSPAWDKEKVEQGGHQWDANLLPRTPSPRTGLTSHSPLASDHTQEARASYLVEPDYTVQVFGQINDTYIVAQVGKEFHVVDQHTVHERVVFERLWRNWNEKQVQTQPLLIPEPVEVQPHTAILLESALPELASLGLEMEPFGQSSFVVRSVPALLGQMDYAVLIQDVIEDLTEWKSVDSIEKRIRPILASLACQGAVQAGRPMGEPEMKVVLEDWVKEGFPMTCPHGRRVTLRFSLEELDKIFRRI